MNKVLLNIVFVVMGLIFLAACGQKGSPTGGPTDETPPKIVHSKPGNYQTNFNQKTMVIKFDEFVKLNDFANNFIISPPVKNFPKFELKGKTLYLKFDTTFKANTTYNLFFGDGIQDFNEGNTLDSNHFVFSTGDFLDSLSLTGTITDALTGELEEDIMIGLYRNLTDSFPAKNIPDYFTKAKNGQFEFTNLAAGEYRIFALKDENNNYLYDQIKEKIAFLDEWIKVYPDEENDSIHLRTFQMDPQKLIVEKLKDPQKGKLRLKFNKSLSNQFNYSFDAGNKVQIYQEEWNELRNELTIFSEDFNEDLISLELFMNYDNWQDTLKLRLTKSELNPPKAVYNDQVAVKPSEKIALEFPLPIELIKENPFLIQEDTIWLEDFTYELDSLNRTVRLINNWKHGKKYSIVLLPKSYKDFFYENSDTLKFSFQTLKKENTANLILNYDLKLQAPVILSLFKGDQIEAEEVLSSPTGNIEFKDLPAGNYSIRLIEDLNKDRQFTPGNFHTNQFPEKVIYYSKDIELRANWDMELNWEAEK